VGAFLCYILATEGWGETGPGNGARSVAVLGRSLLGVDEGLEIFSLLFEAASVLLLVALVAAIAISRRKEGAGGGEAGR